MTEPAGVSLVNVPGTRVSVWLWGQRTEELTAKMARAVEAAGGSEMLALVGAYEYGTRVVAALLEAERHGDAGREARTIPHGMDTPAAPTPADDPTTP